MPNTLRVSWAANPAAEQIIAYELFQSTNGAAFVSLGQAPGTSRDLQLNAGVYRFKVRAHNAAGPGPESDPADGPAVPTKPATPTVETIIP
jgi:hypothetical protein